MPNLKFLTPIVPEIWRNPKISKVGHVIHSRPVNRGSLATAFLNPDLPIQYITFMGLRWRLKVVYRWASPLLRPF